jgi:DNA polymerase I
MAIERGIEVCAPVHDAFLICEPLDQLDARVAEMKFIMEEASRIPAISWHGCQSITTREH